MPPSRTQTESAIAQSTEPANEPTDQLSIGAVLPGSTGELARWMTHAAIRHPSRHHSAWAPALSAHQGNAARALLRELNTLSHTSSVYTPAAFAVDDNDATAFLTNIVAADLVTVTERGLVATYLPVLFVGDRFIAHMATTNEQWKLPAVGESMLIAHGSEAYVSPAWYAAKAEHGRVVPTYNYETAHVYGSLTIHQDAAWLADAVRRLTQRHELHREPAWRMEDAPADFIAGQLRAIVGLEFVISRVEVKRKMSQNRPDGDVEGIAKGLTADGLQDVAALVTRSRRERR